MRGTRWIWLGLLGCRGEGVPTAPGEPTPPACTPQAVYTDADGDGFGDEATARQACEASPGEVGVPGDCDDSDSATHPGALEVCDDGVDNDCDPQTGPCAPSTDLGLAPTITGDRESNFLRALPLGGLDGREALALTIQDSLSTDRIGVLREAPQFLLRFSDLEETAPGSLIATGDLSGDGHAELVYAEESWPLIVSTDALDVRCLVSAAAGGGRAGVAVARDLTGDGVGDLVVFADGDHAWGPRPAVVVLPGPLSGTVSLSDGHLLWADGLSGYFALGDLDGDGVDDLVLEDQDHTSLRILHGPITGDLELQQAPTIVPQLQTSEAIASISVGGDLGGDGRQELLLSTYGGLEVIEGQRFVQGPIAPILSVALAGDEVTVPTAAILGDTDGDGIGTLAVGNFAVAGGAGEVTLFRGDRVGLIDTSGADHVLPGLAAGDYTGTSLSTADWDGDGLPELVIGAVGALRGAGAVYLVDVPSW